MVTPIRSRVSGADALTLVVDALATYRLTRLASVDTLPLAAAPRNRLTRWAREHDRPAVEELIHCPWCIGFWISAAVTVVRLRSSRAWDPLARALALST